MTNYAFTMVYLKGVKLSYFPFNMILYLPGKDQWGCRKKFKNYIKRKFSLKGIIIFFQEYFDI